jgi:hypothetical protein
VSVYGYLVQEVPTQVVNTCSAALNAPFMSGVKEIRSTEVGMCKLPVLIFLTGSFSSHWDPLSSLGAPTAPKMNS